MSALLKVDELRKLANKELNPKKKSSLGQFFTDYSTSLFMASLFKDMTGHIKLLDPGCGPCSLTAAFLDEAIMRDSCRSISVDACDVDSNLTPNIKESLRKCDEVASSSEVSFKWQYDVADFIISADEYCFSKFNYYTHAIINPPYKKILQNSDHRKSLREMGVETVNLYTGFVSVAINKLRQGGEMVVIIPRSFCNGSYYQSFRESLLKETSIEQIHIFDSRKDIFKDDKILQENIILHLIKGKKQGKVLISSSNRSDFKFNKDKNKVIASGMSERIVEFSEVVSPLDKNSFITIVTNDEDAEIVKKISIFNSNLDDLGVMVSTGAVVDFRMRNDLRDNLVAGSVPLLFPSHISSGTVEWPKQSKKANAINISEDSRPCLWLNQGYYILVKRLSSKEESRRIFAVTYKCTHPSKFIGFDNKLNVIHLSKIGMDEALAKGLCLYLNSTLLDKYYRLFGGHTQVNATDLISLKYPSDDSLRKLGSNLPDKNLTQEEIDDAINMEFFKMTEDVSIDPVHAQNKLNQAAEILGVLGLPNAQINERSSLVLLALIGLTPGGEWANLSSPLLGVTPIMDWCREQYDKNYAPNSRETFRRFTLHQFCNAGLALYNPDDPGRAVNSPKACYQVAPELKVLLSTYGSESWAENLKVWLANTQTLVAEYEKARKMKMIPLVLEDGTKIQLSPGIHSLLIKDIVTDFGPRFAPGAEVIYLGDTGAKEDFFNKDRLSELGVVVDRKGKLPDVVLYWPEKNWLLLVESVTSHGPVDGKRHKELSELFKESTAGLVYVTAFPSRKIMNKYLPEISWETEVWLSESPSHMIHFNGDRFLGPHSS